MAPNPISYTEIEAFNRLTHANLSAWDIALIRRLDLAVMAVLNPPKGPKTVPARDGKRVLDLIREKAKPKPTPSA